MPLLSYAAITDYPFQPNTKIFSADINEMFQAVQTLFNNTQLDDANVQSAGLTPTLKLNVAGAAAGQVLGYTGTGSSPSWISVGLTSAYNVIFGSASQVTSGVATNSTFASWSQADGDRVLVLPGYTESVSWTVSKKAYIQGLGNTSQITGGVTFATGASNACIKDCRITTGVTINSGLSGVIGKNLWFPNTLTASTAIVDNATYAANNIEGMLES